MSDERSLGVALYNRTWELFDNRESSATRGVINEFRFGTIRPALVVVPPRVWHGVQNIGTSPGIVLNVVDQPGWTKFLATYQPGFTPEFKDEQLPPCDAAEWESIKRKGDAAIQNWIGEQLQNTSVTVILIGTETASLAGR